MKPGDEFKVEMGGFHVANGIVEDIDGDVVTIVIPATRVQMGVKSTLTPLAPETDRDFTALPETGTQSASPAMTDVEPQTAARADAPDQPVASPLANQAPAVLEETGGRSLRDVELDSSVLDD